jgi:hypothetical protein
MFTLIGTIAGAAVAIILFATIYSSGKEGQVNRCERIFSNAVKEKLSRKYNLPANANSREFEYFSGRRFSISLGFDALWELAEVGDSIKKGINSNIFEIHKADTIIIAPFHCE